MDRRTLLKGFGMMFATGGLGTLLAGCGDDGAESADAESATTAGSNATAAQATTTTAKARAKSVDKLRLAGGQWGYPSPFAYNRGPGLAHCLMMFDTLTWKDSSGEPIAWLASAWESTPDGLNWTFTLHDTTWHDGAPLTAEDVAFTFDYFLNGAGKNAVGIVGRLDFIAAVSAVDARTAKITLSRPYAPFVELVSGRIPILPKHIWAAVTDPAKFRDPTALIGCGPYRADSIDETAGAYRYVANEKHYLGVPYVKVLEFVPAKDELLALEQGDIDAGSPPSEDGVPDEALAAFEGDDWASLEEPGEFTRAFHINMTKGFPYDNQSFRQALAYTIDRADMVKRLLFGRGEPGSIGGLAPSHPWLAAGLPAYQLDVTKAKALLDSIGIIDRNGDGVRELPDGSAFQPELQTSSRYSPKTAELIKEYLKAVGIDLKVTGLDSNTADDNAAKGNYQLALVGYGGFGGDADGLRTRYSATVKAQSFSRVLGYSNAQFEQLAAQQVATVDPAARKALVQQMQQLLATDVAMIPLYFPTRILISRVEVFDNWYYTPGGIFGGYPGVLNKHSFVTGKKTGF